MSKTKKQWGQFVVPGQKLGVIEEFLPGQGTYIEEGNVFSFKTGFLFFDQLKREIFVKSKTNKPIVPQKGTIVIGNVVSVQDRTLTINIFQINDKTINGHFFGVMHVSDASTRYIKTLTDSYKIGDIVRAKVISTTNREFHLSTSGRDLGVLQAMCSSCGNSLKLINNRLRCSSCNRSEKRKRAFDYGFNHEHN